MKYFPISVDLQDRRVVVAGGGEKAAQKLRLLVKTSARVTVVSENSCPEIKELAARGTCELQTRPFHEGDVERAALVFAADDEATINEQVSAAAQARGVPVNVVDGPGASTFIMPAIIDRAPVTVAIGTEGAAPVMARALKSKIEALLPARLGRVASIAQDFRDRIHNEIESPDVRRRVWERLLSGRFAARAMDGNAEDAEREVDREIASAHEIASAAGSVALIGCGPGDPDLLTLKALQRMQDADVLVIDRLVEPAILEYARRDARRIFVGKQAGGPSTSQDEINRILVREALKGHRVARLKGGDAFVFGRAAEEIAAIRTAGIPVEIIPGVTAAHAAAASVGLPITLRRKVQQFSVVTGGAADGEPNLDWAALAKPGQAFAIYMGVRSAPSIAGKLIAAGADPRTTVVVVENATRDKERSVETTIAELSDALDETGIKGPAVIFVGLDWDEAKLSRPRKVRVFEPRPAETTEPGQQAWTAADVAKATYWVAG